MKNEAWVELVEAYFADGICFTPRPGWVHDSEFHFGVHWKVPTTAAESARHQWLSRWGMDGLATTLPAWFWHAMLGEVMFGGRQVRWVEEDQRF